MITFREIDKNNYMEYICLKVKGEQHGFMTDNVRSLAEARSEEDLYTRVVYPDGVMVGFVLSDCNPELPGWCMNQFMIGAQYQGQGLDREAVLRFLDFIKEHIGVRELYPHAELENAAAHEMYQKLGSYAVRRIQYTFDGVVYRRRRMKVCLRDFPPSIPRRVSGRPAPTTSDPLCAEVSYEATALCPQRHT